jgi:uncharacterized protein
MFFKYQSLEISPEELNYQKLVNDSSIALSRAIRQSQPIEIIEALFEEKYALPGFICHDGFAPFYWAIDCKNIAAIKLFATHNRNSLLRDTNNLIPRQTPILLAISQRYGEGIVAIAKEYWQIVEEKGYSREYNDILLLALSEDLPTEIIKSLLDVSATSLHLGNRQIKDKHSYLHWAVKHNMHDIIPLLIHHGASTLDKNAKGQLPIELAVSNGRWDFVLTIAKAGIDQIRTMPNGASIYAKILLQALSEKQPIEIIRGLLEASTIPLDLPDLQTPKDKNSYLHWAVEHNRHDIIPILIHHGASTLHKNAKGQLPIELAVSKENGDCIVAIAEASRTDKRVSIDNDDPARYKKAIKVAIKENKPGMIKILLMSASSNFRFDDGNTPLHLAVEKGHKDITLSLLTAPETSLTQQNKEGQTPIELAAAKGHWDCVLTIIARKETDAQDHAKYHKALAIAIQKNQSIEIIEALLKAGTPTNFKCSDGKTCLDWAIHRKNTAVATLLMKDGATASPKNLKELKIITEPQPTTPETKTPTSLFIHDGNKHPYDLQGGALHFYYWQEFRENPTNEDYKAHSPSRYKSPPRPKN